MAREQMGLQATLRKAVQKVVGISKTTFSFVYLRAFLTLASFKCVQIMTLKLPRVQFAKSSSLEPHLPLLYRRSSLLPSPLHARRQERCRKGLGGHLEAQPLLLQDPLHLL